jgi:HEAT repeat protein
MIILFAALALVAGGCGEKPKKKRSTSKKVKDHIYNLGHKDKAKRQKAEAGLVKIGKPAVKQLIDALEGKTARTTVGVGLMGAAKGGAVALLKGEESVPAYAARILGEIGDDRAVEPLIKSLLNPDAKKDAAGALKKITKQDHGDDPAKWTLWFGKQNKEE